MDLLGEEFEKQNIIGTLPPTETASELIRLHADAG